MTRPATPPTAPRGHPTGSAAAGRPDAERPTAGGDPNRSTARFPSPTRGQATDHPGSGTQGAGRRLRRDAETNRRHILEAAGRLMAERGLATPLEDIASAAGVGIATLYRRFPTRQSLVDALFADRLATYVADLETALAMEDGWEALVWFLRRSTARMIADRGLGEVVDHQPGSAVLQHIRDQLLPMGARLVERAKASGRLRDDVTVADFLLLQKALVAVGTATSAVHPTTWGRYLTILVDGLCTDRAQPTPLRQPPLSLEELHALEAALPRPSTSGRC